MQQTYSLAERQQHIILTFAWSGRNNVFLNKNKKYMMTQNHNHSNDNLFKKKWGEKEEEEEKRRQKSQDGTNNYLIKWINNTINRLVILIMLTRRRQEQTTIWSNDKCNYFISKNKQLISKPSTAVMMSPPLRVQIDMVVTTSSFFTKSKMQKDNSNTYGILICKGVLNIWFVVLRANGFLFESDSQIQISHSFLNWSLQYI